MLKENKRIQRDMRDCENKEPIFFSGFQMTGKYDKSTDLKKYTYRSLKSISR